MTTIHDKEAQDAAMAKLAKVHGHRTESKQVQGLYMVASARPKDAEDFAGSGSFWTCAFMLPRPGQSRNPPPDLVTRYSMGTGLGWDRKSAKDGSLGIWQIKLQPPTCDDVLQCLCMDARGYDDARDFEDWAETYGYDTDSRKAERTYQLVAKIAKDLRRMLGADYDRVVAAGCSGWEPANET